MNDLHEMQRRFMRDALPIRLGNLASNLAHISAFAKTGKQHDAVERLLHDSRYFIEWTAGEAEVETAAELVDMQVQLSRWYFRWKERHSPSQDLDLAQQTRAWSDRALKLSGLLDVVE